MPKILHAATRVSAGTQPCPSMFLVFQWRPGTLPPLPPPKVRPVLPPAPERCATALAAIDSIRAEGVTTLADIARLLNERHVTTLSGRGVWHGAQVARAEVKRGEIKRAA